MTENDKPEPKSPASPPPPPPRMVATQEKRSPKEVMWAARQILAVAERGCADLRNADGDARMPGLMNVAVYGRSMTLGVQRLRNIVDGFDDWYAARMPADDPLLNYFKDMRNAVLKEVVLPDTEAHVHIDHMVIGRTPVIQGTPPVGAIGIFIGDAKTGNSGWIVRLPDGSEEKYYAALAPSFQGRVTLHLSNAPREHLGRPIADDQIETLATLYIAFLKKLVDDAEEAFIIR